MQHLGYGSNSLITQPKDNFYSIPTNTGLSASTIDQHRNSIEQRIANLQAKISKKYNAALQADRRGNSENYLIGYGNDNGLLAGSSVNSRQGNMSMPYVRIQEGINRGDSVVTNENMLRNGSGVRNAQRGSRDGKGLEHLQRYTQGMDQLALKQRKKYDYGANTNTDEKLKNRGDLGLKSSYCLDGSKQRNQPSPQPSNQATKPTTKPRNAQQIKKQSSSTQKTNKNQQPPFCIQTQFQQLNKTISNLRSFTNDHRTIRNYETGNSGGQDTENRELYEMMRSIMVGQQRLEKELERLKGNKEEERGSEKVPVHSNSPFMGKQRSRSRSQRRQKTQSRSIENKSPYLNKFKSPHNHQPRSRSKSPYEKRKSAYSQKRRQKCSSRISQPKDSVDVNASKQGITSSQPHPQLRSRTTSTTGRILSNKHRFQQLYLIAYKQKKLHPSNPITITPQTISLIQNRIKQVIQRTQKQNSDTSNLSHENKRYLKDHLMNTIELQRKLKGDLVRKVYEMCDNKVLYK